MITLLIMTHDRKDTLAKTIESLNRYLYGRVDRRVIHSDARDPAYNDWLTQFTPEYELMINEGTHGFGPAIQNAWSELHDSDYILHWEDDFVLKEKLNVDFLRWILTTQPDLAQIALKRQPWNPQEIAAGGIIEQDPDSYTEEMKYGYVITKHRKFFTTNPCVYPWNVVDLGWPDEQYSEGAFGFKVWDAGLYSAYLGSKFDAPKVEHIGYERGTGSGY
jgi:hypothetical protein